MAKISTPELLYEVETQSLFKKEANWDILETILHQEFSSQCPPHSGTFTFSGNPFWTRMCKVCCTQHDGEKGSEGEGYFHFLFLRNWLRKVLLKDSKKHGKLTHSSHSMHVVFLPFWAHSSWKAPQEERRISASVGTIGARLLIIILQKIPFS